MERDALLAHGTSFLLQDRLMNCSDYSTAWVCRTCGSITSLGYEDVDLGTDIGFGQPVRQTKSEALGEYCRTCRAREDEDFEKQREEKVKFGLAGAGPRIVRKSAGMDVIAMPYVFRYLAAELQGMFSGIWANVQQADICSTTHSYGNTAEYRHHRLNSAFIVTSLPFISVISLCCGIYQLEQLLAMQFVSTLPH